MSELKVTDRRCWAKAPNEAGEIEDEPETRPSYVVELEQKIAAKDEEIQRLITEYKSASSEFEDARARLRKELSKDVERGRRLSDGPMACRLVSRETGESWWRRCLTAFVI